MFARCLALLTATGVALTAGAAPAAAAARYDPAAKTGVVTGQDLRAAFGWSKPELASRAHGIVFDHDFWTDDTYAVDCGQGEFPVVHHREFGRYELTDVLVRDARRGAPIGYGGRLTGFRITGARAGISGTSPAPAPGQPCPEDRGTTIGHARLVSTATGWSLTIRSGDDSRVLTGGA
jgi:hypothetical protein